MVAYNCNPSYSGGRDQEDSLSEPPWAYVRKWTEIKQRHASLKMEIHSEG
jgi:hypothetical protein